MLSAQVILPAYKDGRYWIARADTAVSLTPSITSLGNFDNKGFAVFEDDLKTGIIDSTGKVRFSSEQDSYYPWGNGLFVCREKENQVLLNAVNGDTLLPKMDESFKLNSVYLQYRVEKDTFLFFIPTSTTFPIGRGSNSTFKYFNSLLFRTQEGEMEFYSSDGKKVVLDSLDLRTPQLVTYFKEGQRYVVTRTHVFEIDSDISNLRVNESEMSYYDGQRAHLYDLENDREIVSVPYDRVRFMNSYDEGFYVIKDGKMGFLNTSLQEKISPKYDDIWKRNVGYFVENNNLQGLVDNSFKLRIPCELSYLYEDSSFIYTTNSIGMQGLYTHDFRAILRTQYLKIVINGYLIKAYTRDKLRILKLNKQFRIISDVILKNAVTAKQSAVKENHNYDKRLLPLGWFFIREAITDSIGIISEYKYKWGLKVEDSVIFKPRIMEPLFVPENPFVIATMGPHKFTLNNVKYSLFTSQRLISNISGKPVDKHRYLLFNRDDGFTKNYFRYATTKGYGIWRKNAEQEDVNYVSRYGKEYHRYAKSGKIEYSNSSKETLKFFEWLPITNFGNVKNPSDYNYLVGKYISITNGKWNFLDSAGHDLFEEPFVFANNFYRETAIVKKKTGWGVCKADSIIINCEYSSVARMNVFEDTVFLVKKNAQNFLFLDSALTQQAQGYGKIIKSKGDLSLLQSKEGNAVFYQGEQISDKLRNARILQDNYWILKRKKEYLILNKSGEEILNSLLKPRQVINGEFFLVEFKGKRGIINSNGDTIVPFSIAKLQTFEYYNLVKSREGMFLYDLNFNLLRKIKVKDKIIPNSHTNTYCLIRKKVIKEFDETNEVFRKTKNPDASAITNYSYNFFYGRKLLIQDTITLFLNKNQSIDIQKGGVLQLKTGKVKSVFYKESLSAPMYSLNQKNIRYIGEGAVTFKTKTERIILRGESEIRLSRESIIEGGFQEGFCLIKEGKRFSYLNDKLEVMVTKRFVQAKPFENGRACVKIGNGWTMISKTGTLLSYPSFASISSVSENLFKTRKLPTYGLFDSHGKEIVPCKYEKLKVINANLIQVMLNGQMGYFNIKGEEIFPIR